MGGLSVAPRDGDSRTPRWRRSRLFAALSFTLFLGALAAPAVQVIVLGKPALFPGWLVLWWGVCMGVGSVAEAFTRHTSPSSLSGFVLVGTSALSNVILLLPLWWWRRGGPKPPSRRLRIVWWLAMLLATLAPMASGLGGLVVTTQIGYGLWLAAWFTLGAAMLCARGEAAMLTP